MLTAREKGMIDLAGERFKYAGSLDVEARRRFGMTPTAFWQAVNALLDTEAAAAYRPVVVGRLRDRREMLRRVRATSATAHR